MKHRAFLLLSPLLLAACAHDNGQSIDASNAGDPADADVMAVNGEAAYNEYCAGCHETGMMGAPVAGDAMDWGTRSRLWDAVLLDHAITGYLEMPARGGRMMNVSAPPRVFTARRDQAGSNCGDRVNDMQKPTAIIIASLLTGALLGAVGTYFYLPTNPAAKFAQTPERDIQSVPEVSLAEAEVHRADRYASITTIEDTLALPTDFAETEALYVIAGRGDSDEVQNLIHQAARIKDRHDRKAALGILFLRLTELDPYSALAIARTPAFRRDESFERSVWVAWGRLDLDAALVAAAEGTSAQRNLAAQSLYASMRDLDEAKIQTIKSALGIAPGRSARAQRLYALADESPAAAIRYVESLGSTSEQYEQFGWLAQHLSRNGQVEPASIAELIQSRTSRQIFEQSLMAYGAQRDPESALQQYLSGPKNGRTQNQAYVAFQQLAQQDPEKAIEYLDKMPSGDTRQRLVTIAAAALAKTDPRMALEWARQNDSSNRQTALMSVVAQIAQSDPQLALTEAQSISNPQMRGQAISNVLLIAAQTDPARAAQALETINDKESRRAVLGQLGASWAQTDFEGAVAWVSSLPADDQRIAMTSMGRNLVHDNVDAAIELLERFPSTDSTRLRTQIAQSLAQHRSIESAQSFISQYKGTADYGKLQVAVVSSAASTDPVRAMQLAKSVEDDRARDQLYASIVGQQAARDPQQALRWMESISSPQARSQAVSQIAQSWYSQDPTAAESWVQSLPRGAARDDAIFATSALQRRSPGEQLDLIRTIDDESKRKQAMIFYAQRVGRSDPAEAERILMELDFTDAEREQYRKAFEGNVYYDYGISY